MIHQSALRNEKMWPDWQELNQYGVKSYQEIVEEMKESFLKQLKWMDYQIMNF